MLGSELEAALEELRLIREVRPPANARSARPDRYLYLAAARRPDRRLARRRRPLGPIRSRRRAELAARALQGASESELGRAAPRVARCRASARSSAISPSASATRTRRACATASPRSSRSSRTSRSSSGCAPLGSASSRPPSSRVPAGVLRRPAGGWPPCACCRAGRPRASSSRRAWRRLAPRQQSSRPRTPTSSSSSDPFFAGPRPSSRSCAGRPRPRVSARR